MAILLQAVDVLHERRVRVVFANTLAAGAFGAPAPSVYSLSNVDGLAPSPTVQAALIVPGSPAVVELVLAQPLAKGALYELSAVGVPSTDLSTTPGGSTTPFRWGLVAERTNVEPIVRDRETLLYKVDLLWNGRDYQETATGDLERVSGTANVTKALQNGVVTSGLPWDPSYGGFVREYVDSPSTVAGTLKGSVSAFLLGDPRVRAVKVTYKIEDDATYLYADPTLVSGEAAERVTVEVPSS